MPPVVLAGVPAAAIVVELLGGVIFDFIQETGRMIAEMEALRDDRAGARSTYKTTERMKGLDMIWTATRTLVLCLAGFLSLQSLSAAAGQESVAWTVVLDGTSLKGWNVVGDANWTVADGAVQADKGSGFLVTPASYRDFQVTLEFWVSDDANSGVFLRCSDPKTINQMNAYEVNIFDKRPDQSYRTGGIVDVAKPASVVQTGGKWNTFDITARGSQLTVVLNGATLVDVKDTKHADGPIALQYGAGTVKFRNVRIRRL